MRRFTSGQYVYVLEHRIPNIAKRKHPYEALARARLLKKLAAAERCNITYVVRTKYHTKWSGMVRIVAPEGTVYSAHETDIVRA